MAGMFKKAIRAKKKLRMGIVGPSGSGKTYTALALASGLSDRVACICTEYGSASLYAHKFGFDVLDLTDDFSPQRYIEAIHAAGAEGYGTLVIDGLSQAWMGKGGALEMVDSAAKRNKGGNSYTAWRDVTPWHNKLIDAILGAPCHVIATLRAKTEYVLEANDRGKQVPRKVGMAPVQRDGMEYEFDVVADMDLDHNMIVSKTRLEFLDGAVIPKPGPEVAKRILQDLESGVDAPAPAPVAPPAGKPANGNATRDDLRSWGKFCEDAAGAVPTDIWTLLDSVYDYAAESGRVPANLPDDNAKFEAMGELYDGEASLRVYIRGLVANVVKQMKAAPAVLAS